MVLKYQGSQSFHRSPVVETSGSDSVRSADVRWTVLMGRGEERSIQRVSGKHFHPPFFFAVRRLSGGQWRRDLVHSWETHLARRGHRPPWVTGRLGDWTGRLSSRKRGSRGGISWIRNVTLHTHVLKSSSRDISIYKNPLRNSRAHSRGSGGQVGTMVVTTCGSPQQTWTE